MLKAAIPKSAKLRRGASIIPVIAFYAIAIAMIGVWVRSALSDQRIVRRWHEKTQAVWLVEAGIRRAVARFESEKDYRGERWLLSSEQLGYKFDAEVEISVERILGTEQVTEEQQDSQAKVRIVAIARCPSGAAKRVQATKTTDYHFSESSDLSGESL